jgi:hypothetical protein
MKKYKPEQIITLPRQIEVEIRERKDYPTGGRWRGCCVVSS